MKLNLYPRVSSTGATWADSVGAYGSLNLSPLLGKVSRGRWGWDKPENQACMEQGGWAGDGWGVCERYERGPDVQFSYKMHGAGLQRQPNRCDF